MTAAEQVGAGIVENRTYTFILPPGWFRVDLRKALAPQVRELTDLVLAQRSASGDSSKLRVALVSEMTRVTDAARSSRVLDLVLPVTLIEGTALPVSWAFMPLTVPDGADPIEMLAGIASRNDSALLTEVRELVALRIQSRKPKSTVLMDEVLEAMSSDLGEVVLSPDGGGPQQLWVERVQYFIGDPSRPSSWIVAAASITDTGADDQEVLTPVLVELFDEVVKTVRMPHA